VLCPATEGHVH